MSAPPTAAAEVGSNATPAPPRLHNMYYLRTVGTPKQCFICHKETTLCLGMSDSLPYRRTRYQETMLHTANQDFANPVVTENVPKPTESSPSRAEIDKVTREYKDKHKENQDKSDDSSSSTKNQTTTTATRVATSLFKTGLSAMSSLATTTHEHLFGPGSTDQQTSNSTTSSTGPASQLSTKQQQALNAKVFTLHRSIFQMRQDRVKQAFYKKQATETIARVRLPSVPTTLPG
ncbi:hypothetical protein OIV83_000314 [Microbotryomycetes sp. JL201]|nr:hypothetical protein OIV83_000314 [Microbotryomycetes sp. JL201]